MSTEIRFGAGKEEYVIVSEDLDQVREKLTAERPYTPLTAAKNGKRVYVNAERVTVFAESTGRWVAT